MVAHTQLTLKVPEGWLEPIVRVQSLSEAGDATIPDRYIKPPIQRPCFNGATEIQIPVIDLEGLRRDEATRSATLKQMFEACTGWGFFQVLNHGVSPQLMDRAREIWYEFFNQPMEVKQAYANSPQTYQGYGSRFGIEKGAPLDWGDYFFLYNIHPIFRDPQKWPTVPLDLREVVDEYCKQVVRLGGTLLKSMSINLGLGENFLQDAFGGDKVEANLRANFYPKCPQPELALGLASHSDPSVITILLADENVPGLQVRKNGEWIPVKPVPHAFIVNIGDQMQVLTNAVYTSAEHRVTVASDIERVSLALFYNPKGDLPIGPAKEFVSPNRPALYSTNTFDEYKLYLRTKGLHGKSQIEESPKITQV